MNLTTVIPITTDTAERCTKLIDFIYWQRNRQADGFVLLVFAPDVHLEVRKQAIISAGLAFSHVAETQSVAVQTNQASRFRNQIFKASAAYVKHHYKDPWLFLEHDAVPVNPDWNTLIAKHYDSQPQRFFGRHMMNLEQNFKFMHRTGVYPANAYDDLASYCDSDPAFELSSHDAIIPRCFKSHLFQYIHIGNELDTTKVVPESAIVSGDKDGILMRSLYAKFQDATLPPFLGEKLSLLLPEETNGPKTTKSKLRGVTV